MPRIQILVEVDTDRTPGTFHTKESVIESVQAILSQRIPHYDPLVLDPEKM